MQLEISYKSHRMQNAAQIKIGLEPTVCAALVKWLIIMVFAVAGVA